MSVSSTTTTIAAAASSTATREEGGSDNNQPRTRNMTISDQQQQKQTTNADNNKAASARDEQIEGMSLTEYSDPAILAAKPAQLSFRYGREELLHLRQMPLSQKRPEYLSSAHNNSNGIWDPEMWHRSRSETPSENGVRPEQPDAHKRRPGDPRERIRKEQDGIVLSPQRRSFNSGCFVPLKENQRSNRPHSPLGGGSGGKGDGSHGMGGHRELPPGARRIGSGRILTRDVPWDFPDKEREADNDFGYRRDRKDVDRDRDDRFERRSFGRDFGDMGKDKSARNNNRYGDRRRIANDSRDEEPEWFSGGPLSQHETIELRGFDDAECEKAGKKKHPTAQKKKQKDRAIIKVVVEKQQPLSEVKEKYEDANAKTSTATGDGCNRQSSPVLNNNNDNGNALDKSKNDNNETTGSSSSEQQNSFNFDDILKCDTIAGLLSNGVGGEDGDTTAGGSRFSRWFKRESPVKETLADNSRRSSLQDEHIIRNLLNDISEPNVTIPGDSDLYFAPISPAGNTGHIGLRHAGMPAAQKPLNILEMLQRSKQQTDGHGMKNMDVSSKVLSLEELEARMLQQGGGDPGAVRSGLNTQTKQPLTQKPEDEMMAFKKLLAQVSGGHVVTANNGPIPTKNQPMTLLEMLSHTQQQDEAARLASQIMGPASPNPMSTGHLTNDLAFKLQQVQNQVHAQQQRQAQLDMLNKLMNANMHLQQMGPSPLPDMSLNQSRELLSRPEAQAILRAIHQRIPSPRELQVHTQNIMQRALIKKKLEEQQENFKKRQEMQQRGQSPGRGVSPAKHTASPTPLAFTPTSVLRKMTAEKDEGAKDGNKTGIAEMHGKLPQGRPVTGMKPPAMQQHPQPWNMGQPLKQPAGRPIVKANANLQPSSQQDQQQQYYQQQRLYGQPQQQPPRKIGPQYPPSASHTQQQGPASSHQHTPSLHHFTHQQQQQQHPFSSNHQQQFQQQQLTQHQLRAQHQQHQPPQQQQQSPYNNRSSQPPPPQHWSQQHHQLLTGHNFGGERGGASNNGGDLSPTSNQLARWFSPELLERARAGKVPNMPNLNTSQHAISLEEIERQTAPPVHN